MFEINEQSSHDKKTPLTGWGAPVQVMVCNRCDWNFLALEDENDTVCPHCFESHLELMEGDTSAFPSISPPELILTPSVSPAQLEQQILEFTRGIPFSPGDLQAHNLMGRMKQIYLPAWLADVKTKARWEAEMGFDYQVVSHQERYEQNRGSWQSQQIEEKRTRWEPRLGALERFYQNIAAPALEEDKQIRKSVGQFNFQSAQNFSTEKMGNQIVRLPNRSTTDAWQDVFPQLQSSAADECRRACEADHVRQFHWSPTFADQHWTLLLQPVMTTYYLDDDRKAQPLMIHGQTGRVFGVRCASMKKAKQVSLYILIAALLLFVLSLGSLVFAPLIPLLAGLSAIGAAVSFAVALAALIPIITVWWFNRENIKS